MMRCSLLLAIGSRLPARLFPATVALLLLATTTKVVAQEPPPPDPECSKVLAFNDAFEPVALSNGDCNHADDDDGASSSFSQQQQECPDSCGLLLDDIHATCEGKTYEVMEGSGDVLEYHVGSLAVFAQFMEGGPCEDYPYDWLLSLNSDETTCNDWVLADIAANFILCGGRGSGGSEDFESSCSETCRAIIDNVYGYCAAADMVSVYGERMSAQDHVAGYSNLRSRGCNLYIAEASLILEGPTDPPTSSPVAFNNEEEDDDDDDFYGPIREDEEPTSTAVPRPGDPECTAAFDEVGLALVLSDDCKATSSASSSTTECPEACGDLLESVHVACEGKSFANDGEETEYFPAALTAFGLFMEEPCDEYPYEWLLAREDVNTCLDWLLIDTTASVLLCSEQCTDTCKAVIDEVYAICAGSDVVTIEDVTFTAEEYESGISVLRNEECNLYAQTLSFGGDGNGGGGGIRDGITDSPATAVGGVLPINPSPSDDGFNIGDEPTPAPVLAFEPTAPVIAPVPSIPVDAVPVHPECTAAFEDIGLSVLFSDDCKAAAGSTECPASCGDLLEKLHDACQGKTYTTDGDDGTPEETEYFAAHLAGFGILMEEPCDAYPYEWLLSRDDVNTCKDWLLVSATSSLFLCSESCTDTCKMIIDKVYDTCGANERITIDGDTMTAGQFEIGASILRHQDCTLYADGLTFAGGGGGGGAVGDDAPAPAAVPDNDFVFDDDFFDAQRPTTPAPFAGFDPFEPSLPSVAPVPVAIPGDDVFNNFDDDFFNSDQGQTTTPAPVVAFEPTVPTAPAHPECTAAFEEVGLSVFLSDDCKAETAGAAAAECPASCGDLLETLHEACQGKTYRTEGGEGNLEETEYFAAHLAALGILMEEPCNEYPYEWLLSRKDVDTCKDWLLVNSISSLFLCSESCSDTCRMIIDKVFNSCRANEQVTIDDNTMTAKEFEEGASFLRHEDCNLYADGLTFAGGGSSIGDGGGAVGDDATPSPSFVAFDPFEPSSPSVAPVPVAVPNDDFFNFDDDFFNRDQGPTTTTPAPPVVAFEPTVPTAPAAHPECTAAFEEVGLSVFLSDDCKPAVPGATECPASCGDLLETIHKACQGKTYATDGVDGTQEETEYFAAHLAAFGILMEEPCNEYPYEWLLSRDDVNGCNDWLLVNSISSLFLCSESCTDTCKMIIDRVYGTCSATERVTIDDNTMTAEEFEEGASFLRHEDCNLYADSLTFAGIGSGGGVDDAPSFASPVAPVGAVPDNDFIFDDDFFDNAQEPTPYPVTAFDPFEPVAPSFAPVPVAVPNDDFIFDDEFLNAQEPTPFPVVAFDPFEPVPAAPSVAPVPVAIPNDDFIFDDEFLNAQEPTPYPVIAFDPFEPIATAPSVAPVPVAVPNDDSMFDDELVFDDVLWNAQEPTPAPVTAFEPFEPVAPSFAPVPVAVPNDDFIFDDGDFLLDDDLFTPQPTMTRAPPVATSFEPIPVPQPTSDDLIFVDDFFDAEQPTVRIVEPTAAPVVAFEPISQADANCSAAFEGASASLFLSDDCNAAEPGDTECPDSCGTLLESVHAACRGKSFTTEGADGTLEETEYFAASLGAFALFMDVPCDEYPYQWLLARDDVDTCQDWLLVGTTSSLLLCGDNCTDTCKAIIDKVYDTCSATEQVTLDDEMMTAGEYEAVSSVFRSEECNLHAETLTFAGIGDGDGDGDAPSLAPVPLSGDDFITFDDDFFNGRPSTPAPVTAFEPNPAPDDFGIVEPTPAPGTASGDAGAPGFGLGDGRGNGRDDEDEPTVAPSENNGFGAMDDGFGAMDDGFGPIDDGLNAMDDVLNAMDDGFAAMDDGFGSMDDGFDPMDDGFDLDDSAVDMDNSVDADCTAAYNDWTLSAFGSGDCKPPIGAAECPDSCKDGLETVHAACQGKRYDHALETGSLEMEYSAGSLAFYADNMEGPCREYPYEWLLARDDVSTCNDWVLVDMASSSFLCANDTSSTCTDTCKEIIDNVFDLCNEMDTVALLPGETTTVQKALFENSFYRNGDCNLYVEESGGVDAFDPGLPANGPSTTPAPVSDALSDASPLFPSNSPSVTTADQELPSLEPSGRNISLEGVMVLSGADVLSDDTSISAWETSTAEYILTSIEDNGQGDVDPTNLQVSVEIIGQALISGNNATTTTAPQDDGAVVRSSSSLRDPSKGSPGTRGLAGGEPVEIRFLVHMYIPLLRQNDTSSRAPPANATTWVEEAFLTEEDRSQYIDHLAETNHTALAEVSSVEMESLREVMTDGRETELTPSSPPKPRSDAVPTPTSVPLEPIPVPASLATRTTTLSSCVFSLVFSICLYIHTT